MPSFSSKAVEERQKAATDSQKAAMRRQVEKQHKNNPSLANFYPKGVVDLNA